MHENPHIFLCYSIAHSAYSLLHPLRFPARCTTSSVHVILPSPSATTQQQQQYNGSRAPRFLLCANSYGVCVWGWCTASAGSNHDNINNFTSSVTIKHISSALTPDIRSIQQQQKKKYYSHCRALTHMIGTPVFPFSICDPPGVSSQSHPEGEPCIPYKNCR